MSFPTMNFITLKIFSINRSRREIGPAAPPPIFLSLPKVPRSASAGSPPTVENFLLTIGLIISKAAVFERPLGGSKMKRALIRTAVITSLVTALGVSALAYFALPHLAPVQAGYDQGVPVQAQGPGAQPMAGATAPVVYQRPLPAGYAPAYRAQNAVYYPQNSRPVLRDSYGEPVARRQRSTTKSVARRTGLLFCG